MELPEFSRLAVPVLDDVLGVTERGKVRRTEWFHHAFLRKPSRSEQSPPWPAAPATPHVWQTGQGETRRATPPSPGVTPKSHRARLDPTGQSLVAWPPRATGEMGERPLGLPPPRKGKDRRDIVLRWFRPPRPLPEPAACGAFLQVRGADRTRVLTPAPPSAARAREQRDAKQVTMKRARQRRTAHARLAR